MLVSEVSADYGQVYKSAKRGVNCHAADNNEAKAFDVYKPSFSEENNNSVKSNLKTDKYSAINEWKYFCYKQIVGEKLNILA